MTKKDLQDIVDTMYHDREEITLFEIGVRQEVYILDTFTRATLQQLGFDLSTVSDDTLYRMAYKAELDTERLHYLCGIL